MTTYSRPYRANETGQLPLMLCEPTLGRNVWTPWLWHWICSNHYGYGWCVTHNQCWRGHERGDDCVSSEFRTQPETPN